MELFHHSLSSLVLSEVRNNFTLVLSEVRNNFTFSCDGMSAKTVESQSLMSSKFFLIFRLIKPLETLQ